MQKSGTLVHLHTLTHNNTKSLQPKVLAHKSERSEGQGDLDMLQSEQPNKGERRNDCKGKNTPGKWTVKPDDGKPFLASYLPESWPIGRHLDCCRSSLSYSTRGIVSLLYRAANEQQHAADRGSKCGRLKGCIVQLLKVRAGLKPNCNQVRTRKTLFFQSKVQHKWRRRGPC